MKWRFYASTRVFVTSCGKLLQYMRLQRTGHAGTNVTMLHSVEESKPHDMDVAPCSIARGSSSISREKHLVWIFLFDSCST